MESHANVIYVSPISIAEIAIKKSIGKVEVPAAALNAIEQLGFEKLPFSCEDAATLDSLSLHHKDPLDRMLIAQAINNKIAIMTSDRKFTQYNCRIV